MTYQMPRRKCQNAASHVLHLSLSMRETLIILLLHHIPVSCFRLGPPGPQGTLFTNRGYPRERLGSLAHSRRIQVPVGAAGRPLQVVVVVVVPDDHVILPLQAVGVFEPVAADAGCPGRGPVCHRHCRQRLPVRATLRSGQQGVDLGGFGIPATGGFSGLQGGILPVAPSEMILPV